MEYYGLSGAAAANFGLALLGGGAVAAGGLGIVGGVAVLTAALTFSTDIVFDYAVDRAVEKYQYAKFVEASQQMSTLPLPRNSSGPRSYQQAMKVLERVAKDEPLTSRINRAVCTMPSR